MIRIRNLDKYYNRQKPNEIHVLDDLTYEFPESGMCAIFGPSGCGKTTLLNVLGGLDTVSNGEVSYDETDLAADINRIRNRDIGFIFQNYNLNREETVFDNVAYSLRLCGIDDARVVEERVMAALDNVGMGKFRKRLPDTLSGGQQQRVAIARAIVKNPKVILADEPTGNLDEANTILVMDILKAMSKEHLVILVTHEAKLVDFYCDTVIELSDGKIVGVRENENTSGYVGRNRNDIYLGELEQSNCGDTNTQVEFYGETMDKPVKLVLVHKDGRVFLRIDSPGVTVLDESSEVKLKEGVFREKAKSAGEQVGFDMSRLPALEGTKYGRLFRLRDGIRQGFRANFKNTKGQNKKNTLIVCMFFLGFALVFFTAIFGTKLRNVRNTKEQLNDRTFMIYGGGKEIYDRIVAAEKDPAAAIDYYGTHRQYAGEFDLSNTQLTIQYAAFETFGYYDAGYSYKGSDTYLTQTLPISIAGDGKTVCGRSELNTDDEVVITTQLADRIIEQSQYDFIRGYKELIGLHCNTIEIADAKIVGVIRSDENAVYCTDRQMTEVTKLVPNVIEDINGYFQLAPGECALILNRYQGEDVPEYVIGDSLLYNGTELTLKKIADLTPLDEYYAMLNDGEEIDPEAVKQAEQLYDKLVKAFGDVLKPNTTARSNNGVSYYAMARVFVMCKEDYEAASKRIGKTSLWLYGTREETRGQSILLNGENYRFDTYYLVHSTDPDATTAYLKDHFSDIVLDRRSFEYEVSSGIVTPNDRYQLIYNSFKKDLNEQLIIIAVFFAFFGVCMYFVMRASMMNRTREIGIYRAIGAKRSNIIFRFAVETAVVLLLSAALGYLIASVAVGYISYKATFGAESMVYYPLWMAVVLFVFLFVTGIICGILPVIKLLRKTPSEILAKYDI